MWSSTVNFGFANASDGGDEAGTSAPPPSPRVVFGAFALGGPDHRTSAASLASLFDRVFALDPKRARNTAWRSRTGRPRWSFGITG